MDDCESFGRLDEPGGVDELMGMMTEDVVLTDTLLGGALTGTEMVRDYLTSEVGIGATGITVMHVTDGKIDQHISYWTPSSLSLPRPPSSTSVS